MSVEVKEHTNASAPEGVRLYAVGDIHGRLDLLDRMLGLIGRDRAERAAMHTVLVFLGDYIDRGHESKAVVDRLMNGLPSDMTPVFLKGNHEDFLLSFLHDPLSAAGWLYNGGDATLLSYGVEKRVVEYALWQSRAGLREASAMLRAALPGDHLRFYEALELYYRAGGYFFAHAGVRPGVPLEGQSEEDLLWIREEFLAWPGDFGAVVVHGHTPMLTPEDLHNRIGIDTGAFQTGKLTAVGLEGSRRWFLST